MKAINLSTLIKILAGALFFFFVIIFGGLFTILFIPPIEGGVKVPNVIGKDFGTAFDILVSSNLRVKMTPRFSHEVPPGYVLDQRPSPGSRVKLGRQVELFISQGRTKVVVPDLKGLTVLDAKDAISHFQDPLGMGGLRLGHIAYVHSNEVKEGIVLAQSPLAMSKVNRGTPVNLLVSLGPWPSSFEMPNLTGMKLEEALEKALDLGLVINRIEEVADSKVPVDVVINQAPPEGYLVKKGDLIDLTVSKGGGREVKAEEVKPKAKPEEIKPEEVKPEEIRPEKVKPEENKEESLSKAEDGT